jgi:hypothetical protein
MILRVECFVSGFFFFRSSFVESFFIFIEARFWFNSGPYRGILLLCLKPLACELLLYLKSPKFQDSFLSSDICNLRPRDVQLRYWLLTEFIPKLSTMTVLDYSQVWVLWSIDFHLHVLHVSVESNSSSASCMTISSQFQPYISIMPNRT